MGGVLPLVAGHFERVAQMEVMSQLRRFHYDTALRASEVGLFAAVKTVGVSQLLFGTDAPLRESKAQVAGLAAYPFTDGERRQIDYENARRLLTRKS